MVELYKIFLVLALDLVWLSSVGSSLCKDLLLCHNNTLSLLELQKEMNQLSFHECAELLFADILSSRLLWRKLVFSSLKTQTLKTREKRAGRTRSAEEIRAHFQILKAYRI